jgi:transcriptional regulator GlxA family with amidase domain
MNKTLHFVVVAVDGCFASAVYGPLELVQGCQRLQAALPELPPCAITTEVLSPNGALFLSTSGYRHPVDGGLKDLPEGSVILVPGFGLPHADALPKFLDATRPLGTWLKRQHAAGHTIVGSFTGNFLLAEHDLLRHGKATTYWLYADAFRERYPHLALELDTVLIEDERVFSVGGAVCGVDAVLTIIERFIGRDAARLCTKLLVLETRRPSELRYEKRQPTLRNDRLVDRAVSWIRGNLHAPITGEGVQAFIQRLRIDRAKLLLETSTLPIERILDRVGYQDKSAFARQFKRHTQLTPNQYRQRYNLSQGA